MAGDWIKMRDNLWDDPRVAKLVDLTDSSEAAIIGALYWVWSTADQHTEDGLMKGLTPRMIDRKVGIKSFGDAMIAIGWLSDTPDGVCIVDFDRHNGASAKKRCQTAKRVANHAAFSAPANAAVAEEMPEYPHLEPDTNAVSVSSALAREREEKEKRKEENTGGERERASAPEPAAPSAVASPPPIFSAENREFIATERPDLDGTTVWLNFCDHYPAEKRNTASWRKWVRREMRGPVAGVDLAPAAATSDPDSKHSIETLGLSLGMGRWDQLAEPWAAYKAKVKNNSAKAMQ